MRISDATIETLLTRKGISKEQISDLKEEGVRSRRLLQDIVIQNSIMDEKTLVEAFAEFAQIPFVEIDPDDITQDVLNKIPERIARQYNTILFKIDENGTQYLAMDDPDDVRLDGLERVVLARVHVLHRGRVEDRVDAVDGAAEAVQIPGVADEVPQARVVGQAVTQLELLVLIAAVDADAAGVGAEQTLDDRTADGASPARDEHGLSSEIPGLSVHRGGSSKVAGTAAEASVR